MRNAIYINLSHRTDRKASMEKNWDGIVNLHRFNAVKNDIGRLGVYKSHKEILTEIQSESLYVNEIIVLEDDAVPCGDFNKRLDIFMKELPKDWDIFMLGYFSKENSKFEKVSENIYKAQDRICASHSYIINPSSYYKILSEFENSKYEHNIDVLLMEVQKKHNVYISIPTLTYQHSSYSDVSKSNDKTVSDGTKRFFKEWLD